MAGFVIPHPSDEGKDKKVENEVSSVNTSIPLGQGYETLYPSNTNSVNKRKLKVSNEENNLENNIPEVALEKDSPPDGTTVFKSPEQIEGMPIFQTPVQRQVVNSFSKLKVTPNEDVPFVLQDANQPPHIVPVVEDKSFAPVVESVPFVAPNPIADKQSPTVFKGVTAREILSLEDIESLDAVIFKLNKLLVIAESKKTVVRAQNEVSKGLLD